MSWRILAAVAAVVSAYVHFDLWRHSAARVAAVDGAFLLNALAGLVIAVLLLRWRSWVPAFLVAGFGASTLGALVLAATVGLMGFHEAWAGPYVWISAVAEVLCIVAGLVLLGHARTSNSRLENDLS